MRKSGKTIIVVALVGLAVVFGIYRYLKNASREVLVDKSALFNEIDEVVKRELIKIGVTDPDIVRMVHEEKEKFELQGLGLAWKHRTMDAEVASGLIYKMVEEVENSFSDGLAGNWENFKVLRGKGHSPSEIVDLYRMKRRLHLALEEENGGPRYSSKIEKILKPMEKMIR